MFNPTAFDINLADYYLAILENGNYVPTYEITLSGTLKSNETFVIISDDSRLELKDRANLVTEKLKFDGNDTIQLRTANNNTFIDSIYEVGNISPTLDNEAFC